MAGLEVEEEEPVAPAFSRVVVAQVVSVDRHPNADRLSLCRVDVGRGELLQIVCGAPNVAAGSKVPCALVGAALPGGLQIRLSKVRGVESFGMLCSARELGVADDASGLLLLDAAAPVGEDLRRHLDLDDRVLTLKLTPNRADCLSLEGVAREVAALTGAPANYIQAEEVPVAIASERAVVLDAPAACPRYCGRVIGGVDATAATPSWMRRRLERSGLRPISALVDITNYVMLELGQPLHAFDNQRLAGAVHARMAQPGETIKLLNEQTVELQSDVLLIADERRPLAMAGVMGGEDSGIRTTAPHHSSSPPAKPAGESVKRPIADSIAAPDESACTDTSARIAADRLNLRHNRGRCRRRVWLQTRILRAQVRSIVRSTDPEPAHGATRHRRWPLHRRQPHN